MHPSLRKLWPVFKAVFAVAIAIMIGRLFWRDLRNPDLWHHSIEWPWLVLSGVLYILGLGFSVIYWYRLLWSLGQRPGLAIAARAHYIGQMGKYLPGKAWALFLRANLARGPHVSLSVAILTSFYEVFTIMAAGALVSAVIFGLEASNDSVLVDWHALHQLITLEPPATPVFDHKAVAVLAVLMLLVVGIPILPAVFDRLLKVLVPKWAEADDAPVARIRLTTVLQGLALGSCCWLFFGASLWAVVRALVGESLGMRPEVLGHYTAYIALAYVAGFLIIFVPSGLGVREFFLTLFLLPEMLHLEADSNVDTARRTAVLAVVVLRLVWTAMELVVVGFLYRFLPNSVLATAGQDLNP
jgi:uncharacterized membrane protein YbhN (UPF0104 family)